MIFNIHHGQKRPAVGAGGLIIPGQMRHQDKSPKKALIMAGLRPGDEAVCYRADIKGDVEIKARKHILAMMDLGWPISDDGRLIWPEAKSIDSEYTKRILLAVTPKGRRMG